MARTSRWCLGLIAYWSIVVYFLRAASPVFMDGAGPMPSFTWGAMPAPELGEYMRHRSSYDLTYSIPYYVVGLVMTMTGLGITPLILRRVRASRSHAFTHAAAMTLALTLMLAIVSDAGTLLRTWDSPLFVLHQNHDWWSFRVLCQILLPTSLLSGVAAVAMRPKRGRSDPGRSDPGRSDPE